MVNIDLTRVYTLQEVVDKKLIPHVKGYAKLYAMVTQKVRDDSKKGNATRVLATVTSDTSIKPYNAKIPWNKISGKITIQGAEIYKFLQIHNINNN